MLGEKCCYPVVYRQFKDRNEISEEIDIEATTKMDEGSEYDLPEAEDPYKGDEA